MAAAKMWRAKGRRTENFSFLHRALKTPATEPPTSNAIKSRSWKNLSWEVRKPRVFPQKFHAFRLSSIKIAKRT